MSTRTEISGNLNASNNDTQVEEQAGVLGISGIDPDTIPAVVMMVFILVINGGVIMLISSYKYLRTTSNLILASLAASDFLVGLVGIPLLVTCSATFSTRFCLSSTIFFTFISLSTVLHITVMTCDRFIYIIWALRYRDIVNRYRVLGILALTWLVGLTPLVRLSWTLHFNMETAVEDLTKVREKENVYFMFNFVVFFMIPLVVMTALDTHMLLLLRQQCRRIAKENLPAENLKHENKMQKRQTKVVFTCILLLLLYVCFWLPYFILDLMQYYFTESIELLPDIAQLVIYYLRLCSSLCNPFAYTLRKPDLKKAVRSLVLKVFPRLRRYHLAENRTEQFRLSSRGSF